MTDFTIEIAGRRVGVSACYETLSRFCADYLSGGEPDFSVALAPEDLEREREMSIREARLEGRADPRHSLQYLETIALQRKIAERLLAFDTILFHGSAVAVDGACYLFTAKSGTGKSTHTRLWRELLGERAVMVNDDKPFLRIADGGVTAYGTPWNGKHRLGANIAVPLKAICILERGEENRIVPITAKEALPMLLQQSHRPADRRMLMKYLELLDGLAEGTAFYRLECNMDSDAARVSYEAMANKR